MASRLIGPAAASATNCCAARPRITTSPPTPSPMKSAASSAGGTSRRGGLRRHRRGRAARGRAGPGRHFSSRRCLSATAGIPTRRVSARPRRTPAAPRFHHQRHVLRSAGRQGHRLCRRPGGPAGRHCPSDRRAGASDLPRTSCDCCGPCGSPRSSISSLDPPTETAIREMAGADHGRQRRANRGRNGDYAARCEPRAGGAAARRYGTPRGHSAGSRSRRIVGSNARAVRKTNRANVFARARRAVA